MNPPNDHTEPTDPTEAELRAALDARAGAVAPHEPDVDRLGAAIAADAGSRRRRNRILLGVVTAAAVIIAVGFVSTLGDGDPDRVTTASEDETTLPPEAVTEPTATAVETTTTNTTVSTSVTTTETTMPATTTTNTPPTTTTTTTPALPGASVDPKSGGGHGAVPALLTDLRIGCNAGSDRVVLEFRDGAIPTWSVAYVTGPIIEDPTGEVVHVAGNAHLQIRLDGATGFDAQAEEPSYPGPRRVSGGCPGVTEVLDTGDFEGIYNWTVGLDGQAPFTVSTLGGPSRMVIDIAHSS